MANKVYVLGRTGRQLMEKNYFKQLTSPRHNKRQQIQAVGLSVLTFPRGELYTCLCMGFIADTPEMPLDYLALVAGRACILCPTELWQSEGWFLEVCHSQGTI